MADVFLIAGINQTLNILLDRISIEQVLTSAVDTCSFSIKNHKPSEGDEVIVEIDGVRVFGGIVDIVKLSKTTGIHIWDVDCQDYTYQLDRKLVVETYENMTANQIVKDILIKYGQGFTGDHIRPGAPTVQYIVFDYLRPSECFKKLADYCGWDWYVDYYRDVWFFNPATDSSVVPSLVDSSFPLRNLKHTIDTQGLRNRVYVRGGTMLSDPFVYEIKADGAARIWTLPHKPHNLSLTTSSMSVRVGIENVDDEALADYLVNYQEKYVKASSQTATLPSGATLTFAYQYDIDIITMVEDLQSQQGIAAVQGGDGVYEHVITNNKLFTVEAAEAAGLADLKAFSNPRVKGSLDTEMPGITPGQLLHMQLPNLGISGIYIVQSVTLTPLTPDQWTYHIEYGGRLLGIPDLLRAVISAQDNVDVNNTARLNKFVYGAESVTVTDQLATTEVPLPFMVEVSYDILLDPATISRVTVNATSGCVFLLIPTNPSVALPQVVYRVSTNFGGQYGSWIPAPVGGTLEVSSNPGVYVSIQSNVGSCRVIQQKKAYDQSWIVCSGVVV
ncbi:hypothetical protein GJ688_17660 [Heliobacillus mobilis]|uniref:Uncharacterized protein n=1 Tax=Heliobacterium mobile TaxID=28064 RepID=A0A6I3SP04_HELMO|nr:hypothetical protein [Heliobacterium mobile]MTV50761.1 hypothetical protein [Heliobacterium mobile]